MDESGVATTHMGCNGPPDTHESAHRQIEPLDCPTDAIIEEEQAARVDLHVSAFRVEFAGHEGQKQLASLSLRPVVASRLAANLRLIDELGREIVAADRELQALFRGDDRLASWAGLTPTERSSADHTRQGHISKQGSRWLRWTMVEAAARVGAAPGLHRFTDPSSAAAAAGSRGSPSPAGC